MPRLGVESELQLPAYTTAIAMPGPSHVCDLYHTHGNAGSLTHWARPGIKPLSSWILVGLVTAEPWWELLTQNIFNHLFFKWGTKLRKIQIYSIKMSFCRVFLLTKADSYLHILTYPWLFFSSLSTVVTNPASSSPGSLPNSPRYPPTHSLYRLNTVWRTSCLNCLTSKSFSGQHLPWGGGDQVLVSFCEQCWLTRAEVLEY